ncbi:MAG: hypothetical protein KDI44_12125 [Thiothrix sp.]|nr:hypothetical protein [Thiothrix sp.]HPQ97749.1 hypothetical protein [Thiolinea sp.]
MVGCRNGYLELPATNPCQPGTRTAGDYSASEWAKISEARLRQAASGLNIPIVELLQWYHGDLQAIATDSSITDTVLRAFVEDYARHRQYREVLQ